MVQQAGSVLDSSALLAFLQGEPGSLAVLESLTAGAVLNVVNYSEVLTRLAGAGESPEHADRRLREEGLIGGIVAIVPVTQEDAVEIARLRDATRAQGLSLGDRACLATATRLQRPAVTADRAWASVDIGVPIRLIRP